MVRYQSFVGTVNNSNNKLLKRIKAAFFSFIACFTNFTLFWGVNIKRNLVYMLIIQSRGQGIFNRVYTVLTQFIWYIVIGLFVAVFTDNYPKDILFNLSVVLTLLLFFSIWLLVFNSGKTKVIEHGLELNEHGITYINYGDRVTVSWSDFVGFNVINRLHRFILLKSSGSENIEFSFYMFSSAQRRELFDYLEKNSTNKPLCRK
jgi:hypothetical protein